MATININIERKVWGAPTNSRGDSVIEFTPGISREADDYGMPLNGDLPESHAAVFAFTRPSGRLTMVIAQGDYTRFEGMGRRYNMRAVAEMAPDDVARLHRPMAVMLDHLDLIRDYDSENRQVDASVTVTVKQQQRPSGDSLLLANILAYALTENRKVYVKLPAEDALFGDKIRQATRLTAIIGILDAMPATVRQAMGLAFGVERGYSTYDRFIGDARLVAHFGDMDIPADAVSADWSAFRLAVATSLAKQSANAFQTLVDRERAKQAPSRVRLNRAASAETETASPANGDGDEPAEPEAAPRGRWAQWWHALSQAGPLPALLALLCLLAGAVLGARYGAHDTTQGGSRHEAVLTADTAMVSQSLVQQRQYTLTDSLSHTAAYADTLVGDIAFDHPMTHIANWNREELFKTNHIHVTLKMRLRNDSLYTDTLMSREIDRERLLALDNAYYASLGSDARQAEFSTACTLTLSNGTAITITPDNSLLRQADAMGDATMVQVKELNVGGKTFAIDNDAFQRLNGGVKRGLNMPVYYLWVVSELERCRNEADINKLFAY